MRSFKAGDVLNLRHNFRTPATFLPKGTKGIVISVGADYQLLMEPLPGGRDAVHGFWAEAWWEADKATTLLKFYECIQGRRPG